MCRDPLPSFTGPSPFSMGTQPLFDQRDRTNERNHTHTITMGVQCFTHTVRMSLLRWLHFKQILNERWPRSCDSLLEGSRITVNEEGKNRAFCFPAELQTKHDAKCPYSASLSWLRTRSQSHCLGETHLKLLSEHTQVAAFLRHRARVVKQVEYRSTLKTVPQWTIMGRHS